jgi:fungal type III polyketide synthase
MYVLNAYITYFSGSPNVDLSLQALRHFPHSPELLKILAINRNTGIQRRPALCNTSHPFFTNGPPGPTIAEVSDHFRTRAVGLAAKAARLALDDAGITKDDLTHVVCTTMTDNSTPGYDIDLVKALGVATERIERYLIAGVGCAGGLSALRTAANAAIGALMSGRSATVLVVATEVVTPLANMELARAGDGFVSVTTTLFSDGASAIILRARTADGVLPASPEQQQPASLFSSLTRFFNWAPVRLPMTTEGVSIPPQTGTFYSLIGFTSWTVPDTTSLIRWDASSHGWTSVLKAQVPSVVASAVPATLKSMLDAAGLSHLGAKDLDWAIHPGGAAILKACGEALELAEDDHLRASWSVYRQRGNSSSATIFSVLQTLRSGAHAADLLGPGVEPAAERGQPREYLMAVAFGPGIVVEMALFRRTVSK